MIAGSSACAAEDAGHVTVPFGGAPNRAGRRGGENERQMQKGVFPREQRAGALWARLQGSR